METEKEKIISEDSSTASEPISFGSQFPRPDFTEIISQYPPEPPSVEKSEAPPPTKPTFKNILQAKKRLQAFSSKTGSLPVSPVSNKKDEKSEEGGCASPRKTKKLIYHDDRARAVIEEIEEIKRQEDDFKQSLERSRSRSHSKERFKRVGRKSRNYRRRSSSPETVKKSIIKSPEPVKKPEIIKKPTIKKKYPKDWNEFYEFETTFETIREQYVTPIKKNNEIVQQMQFELPSLPITSYSALNAKGVEKEVPFENIRYTRTKPIVCYSANNVIRPRFVSKKFVLGLLPKEHVSNLEKLYSSSIKFKREPSGKTRNWYSKTWKSIENECKLLEKSVGLSFLQSYQGEEEEPEDPVPNKEEKPRKKSKKASEKKIKKKKKEKASKRKLKKDKKKRKKKSSEETKSKVKLEKEEKTKRKRKVSEISEEEPKRIKVEKASSSSSSSCKNETEIICDKQQSEPKTRKKTKTEPSREEEDEEEEKTPDTDDYHSLWESSDDDVPAAPAIPRPSLKPNRSWESDEELFDRTSTSSKPKINYTTLEIPLNIQNFSRRPEKLDAELKLLEEERRTLSEERKKLEIEKQKILKMQEESLLVIKEEARTPPKLETSGLENEYEEFIKAVSNNDVIAAVAPAPVSSKKKSRVSISESSESSSSSSSESSDSDSNHKKKKRRSNKRKKKRKIEGLLPGKDNNIFNEFDILVPSELPEMVPPILPPLPVPSPLSILPCIPVLLNLEDKEKKIEEVASLLPAVNLSESEEKHDEEARNEERVESEIVATKPFVFPSITLAKKTVLEKTKVNLNDDDDEEDDEGNATSVDFTEKFSKTAAVVAEPVKTIERIERIESSKNASGNVVEKDSKEKKPVEVKKEKRSERRRSRSRSREKRRRDVASPKRRFSPVSRRRSPLPRRRRSSPIRRSRRRSPSLSPIRSRNGRGKRTPSPPRNRRNSPLNSPLDGFKRSVADSTISDDMLPQPSGFVESPTTFLDGFERERERERKHGHHQHKRGSLSPPPPQLGSGSPRRISLDDRINQVLGLEKNMGEVVTATAAAVAAPIYANSFGGYGGYEQQQHGRYQYGYGQYGNKGNEYGVGYGGGGGSVGAAGGGGGAGGYIKHAPSKVVQVGNILQVVPSEEIQNVVLEQKPIETQQKIVQVGNMLQIVPAIMPTTLSSSSSSSKPPSVLIDTQLPQISTPHSIIPPSATPLPSADQQAIITPIKPEIVQSAESLMKQKKLERKAEREKRRQERDRRRKDKEKKRKEKDKRKQIKQKLKTENLIKRALQMETESQEEDDNEDSESSQWTSSTQAASISVIVSTPSLSSSKSILLTGGSRSRKSVQFADGIRPGEGTSPSAGEELSSPPPQKPPKTSEIARKRVNFSKKTKHSSRDHHKGGAKKKKIKVKVVKKAPSLSVSCNSVEEDDEDEIYESLPPPSPPPGSPPPHIFPPRIKLHTVNNVHQYNILNSPVPGYGFRPSAIPIVLNRATAAPGPHPHSYLSTSYHPDLNSIPYRQ